MNRRDLIKGSAVIAGAAVLPKVAVANEMPVMGLDPAGSGDCMAVAIYDGGSLKQVHYSDANGVFPPLYIDFA